MKRPAFLFLALLLAASTVELHAQHTVILVRHAEKASDPPRDPELTEEGTARAIELADLLEHMDIDHIISSQFTRTKRTVEPLAARRGLEIEIVGAGTSPEALQAVVSAVAARPDGETIVVAGHSNTVPRLVGALGGPALDDLQDHEYDSIYVMNRSRDGDATMMRLRFGAPNKPAPATEGH